MIQWIRKVDSRSSEVWTTPLDVTVTAINVDAQGDVLLAGGSATALAATFTKLTSDGDVLFTTEFGGAGAEATLVAADPFGNVFVAGDTLDGPATEWDVFVRRFDATGAEQNRWPIASDDRDGAYDLAVDASGAAIVVGYAEGTVPGQTAFGGHDVFVARIAP